MLRSFYRVLDRDGRALPRMLHVRAVRLAGRDTMRGYSSVCCTLDSPSAFSCSVQYESSRTALVLFL